MNQITSVNRKSQLRTKNHVCKKGHLYIGDAGSHSSGQAVTSTGRYHEIQLKWKPKGAVERTLKDASWEKDAQQTLDCSCNPDAYVVCGKREREKGRGLIIADIGPTCFAGAPDCPRHGTAYTPKFDMWSLAFLVVPTATVVAELIPDLYRRKERQSRTSKSHDVHYSAVVHG